MERKKWKVLLGNSGLEEIETTVLLALAKDCYSGPFLRFLLSTTKKKYLLGVSEKVYLPS